MNIGWPHRVADKAGRRGAARVWVVGAAVVAVAGAAAMAAPGAFAATKHATTTKMSAVSGKVGSELILTAKVAGGSTPTGWVEFIYGGKTLCSAGLSNGIAHCRHAFTSVGSFKVEAYYEGNSTHKVSSGVATVKTVVLPTTTKVTAAGDPFPDETVVLEATVASSTYAATGTVTFSDAGGKLGTAKVSGGKAILDYKWAADGTYKVTGNYSGDSRHSGSSGTTSVVVGEYATTTEVTNNFPITEPVDTPATVNVQVTDNVAGGPAPTGSVLVTSAAPWADNAGYTGPVEQCTATLTPAAGLLDGLAYSTGSCGPLGGDGWGFIEFGATYTANSTEFAGSDNEGTEVKIINLYPDTTTVTAPAGTAGDQDTLVATLGGPGGGNVLAASPEAGLYGGPANPDTITFMVTDDTGTVVATCDTVPLAGGTTAPANYADCNVTLPAGTYTVTAVFAGDEYAAGSTGTGTLTIDAAAD